MSTTLVRKEDVQRKWYVLDAADKPLGRTAVIAANILRGKTKPDFTPNRQEAGAEVLSPSFRLDRRPEGNQV